MKISNNITTFCNIKSHLKGIKKHSNNITLKDMICGNQKHVIDLINTSPILSPLKILSQINLGIPNHQTDILSHSLRAFNNALELSSSLSFTEDLYTKKAYEQFFSSKLETSSEYSYRDIVSFATLVHDIGMGMTMKDDKGNIAPIVRFDEESGHLIARGHAKVGANAAYKMAMQMGMIGKESEYIASLVRNHMYFGGIKSIAQESMVIGYLKKVNFDLGAPFVVLCDNMALDKKDRASEIAIIRTINYPFSFFSPICTANMSLLDMILNTHKAHKIIYIVLERANRQDDIAQLLKKDHIDFIDGEINKAIIGMKDLVPDDMDEIRSTEDYIKKMYSEKNKLLADPKIFDTIIKRALKRIRVCSPKDLKNIYNEVLSSPLLRQELPITLFY